MRLYKNNTQVILEIKGQFLSKEIQDWDQLINRKGLYQFLLEDSKSWTPIDFDPNSKVDAPINRQEVWAAGVTYLRSKTARMEESEASGGATFYDKVYDAERPELFFKATPERTVGTQDTLFIRRDSQWNVPEPELTLFISSEATIEAYTIGNDMSSRDIEGENPLYLPQAKSYDRSAGLGPCLLILDHPISLDTWMKLEIIRKGEKVFEAQTQINQMKRQLPELVEFLCRECSFPNGVFLMTGTCLVPDAGFTLAIDDEVHIHIEGIGTLKNTIGQKAN